MSTSSPFVFNGALIGALGGPERWIENQSTDAYVDQVGAATAFATALANLADDPPTGKENASARLLQGIVQSLFADRLPQSQNAADYVEAASAVLAEYAVALSELFDEPGGASVPPLNLVYYVEASNTEDGRDGSIGNPYSTIQEAYDAHQVGTFLVTPQGTVGALDIPSLDGPVSIVGITTSDLFSGGAFALMGGITVHAGLENLSIENMLINASITGAGDPGWTGTLQIVGSEVDGDIDVPNNDSCILQDVTWSGTFNGNAVSLYNCFPSAGSFVVAAELGLDGPTYQRLNDNSVNFSTIPTVELFAPANSIVSDYAGTNQALLPVHVIGEGGLLVRESNFVRGKVGDGVGDILVWDGATWSVVHQQSVAGDTGGNEALENLLAALALQGIILNNTT